MNALDELQAVLPTPRRPYHSCGDWPAIEVALGTRLPSDYKAFISIYGSGWINGTLCIVNPFNARGDGRQWSAGCADNTAV